MTPEQIEELRADMAAGTPGPWSTWMDEDGARCILRENAFITFAFPAECGAGGDTEANARRIARVPTLEAEVLRLTEERAALAEELAAERANADMLAECIAYFNGRVMAGEIRSKVTFRKFCEAYAAHHNHRMESSCGMTGATK